MAAILTAIGLVFAQVMTQFADVAELYTTTPILQIGVAFVVIGFVVGILTRLLGVRA